MKSVTRTLRLKWLWIALSVLLLGARLASPLGFMPSQTGTHFSLVPCPDYGPELRASKHHHHSGEKGPKSQLCPFAAGSSLGVLAQTPALNTEAVAYSPAIVPDMPRRRFGRADRILPPVRGPPDVV